MYMCVYIVTCGCTCICGCACADVRVDVHVMGKGERESVLVRGVITSSMIKRHQIKFPMKSVYMLG